MNSLIRKAALIAALALAVPILGQGPVTPVTGAGGTSADLSNLTNPTAINLTTLTFAGAGGLATGGTNHGITLTTTGTGTITLSSEPVIVGKGTGTISGGHSGIEINSSIPETTPVGIDFLRNSAIEFAVTENVGTLDFHAYTSGLDSYFNSNGVFAAPGFGTPNNHPFILQTAPTISSGFGTTPTIPNSNGTAAFTINVGTGGTATTGVLIMPAATTGWVVNCTDVTTQNSTVDITKQIGVGTTTSVTIGNFTDLGAAGAWAASDILACTAMAY